MGLDAHTNILVETAAARDRQGKQSGRGENVLPAEVDGCREESSKGSSRGQSQPWQGSSPGPKVGSVGESRHRRGRSTSGPSPGSSTSGGIKPMKSQLRFGQGEGLT